MRVVAGVLGGQAAGWRFCFGNDCWTRWAWGSMVVGIMKRSISVGVWGGVLGGQAAGCCFHFGFERKDL